MVKVEDINLTDSRFWTRPMDARHEAFKALRAAPRLQHYEEPQVIIAPPGPGYYALTRYEDVREAS
ncbi:cytochrome P450, partial [Actinomadura adrarensis]